MEKKLWRPSTGLPIGRRAFLKAALLAGAFPTVATTGAKRSPPPSRWEAEAARLTRTLMDTWWSPSGRMFRAAVASAETVPSDPLHNNGYVFWPSLVGLHALVEGERNHPGTYARQIAMVFQGLEQFFDPARHCYDAWLHFPGNGDSYYDDNAWAVITLVEAHNATRQADPANAKVFLARAEEVMIRYVYAGWDDTGKPGGMRWGADPIKPNTSDRATSATAAAALAALMLARAGVNPAFHTRWGHDVLTWLMTHLRDTDGLVMDALVPPDWTLRRIQWTYNTGVPLRAFVEHHRLTGSQDSLAQATALARAALDHRGRLFDGLVRDPAKRNYYDAGYFVHYLVDGLLQLAQETSDHALAASLQTEAMRSAEYAHTYLRDADGLYWRNWRLWRIGDAQTRTWETLTGQTTTLDADPSERSMAPKDSVLPVAQRPLVKTLLANAGMARLFWLVSRPIG